MPDKTEEHPQQGVCVSVCKSVCACVFVSSRGKNRNIDGVERSFLSPASSVSASPSICLRALRPPGWGLGPVGWVLGLERAGAPMLHPAHGERGFDEGRTFREVQLLSTCSV